MCGIAGVIGPNQERTTQALRAMTDALTHRGPDDHGQELFPFGNNWLGLGQRRLAILDLSPHGHQPMTTAEPGGPWITFNGELYNYQRFRSQLLARGQTLRSTGDTETLLYSLRNEGPTFLKQLEGMFAFGYFDPSKPSLLLARDPTGMKPLYFAESNGYFLFASEVRSILASGLVKPKLDQQSIAGYLAYGAVQHPSTLYEGIHSLPPGFYWEIGPGRCRLPGGTKPESAARQAAPTEYWTYPEPAKVADVPSTIEAVRSTVDAAVKSHLISDVPVGLFLSSGIDSTILAGLAGKHSPAMNAFTVSFADQPDFDESQLAAETAKLFGLHHTIVNLSKADAEASVGDWLEAMDQPSIDGLNVFVISDAVRQQGIKVAFSGQGGDELFGGYPSFRDVPKIARLARAVRPFPGVLRRQAASILTMAKSSSVRAKLRDMVSGASDMASLCFHRRRLMSDSQMASLGIRAKDLNLTPAFHRPEAEPDWKALESDPVALISRVESAFYQGNMLLRDGDNNGMAFGLEIRLPLLGQHVVDLAHSIPGSVRLPPGAPTKYLLRQAFPDLLRENLIHRPKMGFTLPIRRWMQTSLRSRCDEALTTLKDLKLLNPDGIDGVEKEFRAEPESPSWSRLFSLCVLGDYVRRHGA